MVRLSVIIPVYNEKENIQPMLESLLSALEEVDHELIFVDDGSTDGTSQEILRLTKGRKNVDLIVFSRNFGQTSAMAAGIEAATGEYLVTLDGDLQNDPSDILIMLKKLEDEALDIVAGVRVNRQDGAFLRKLPSKLANRLIRHISQVHIQDYGCTLKVFRASVAKQMGLYGELHRFIPILASMEGARIAEMPVKHHARRFGKSKYGLGRTFRVLSDLMLMFFFLKYRQKPMHLFGTLGGGLLGLGVLIELYLVILKIFGEDIGGRPLFFAGILFLMTGVQLITTGFLAELQMRTYYGSQDKRPYNIRDQYTAGEKVYTTRD